jgi:hypothetical protein
MIVDTGNVLREDLSDIYGECERITALKARANGLDPDLFVINKTDYNLIHTFAMEGAGIIADSASMVKLATQTGIDALSIVIDATTGEDILEYPEANEYGVVASSMGKNHESGEKMVKTLSNRIEFAIEGLEGTQLRYTVVQGFIKTAMIYYILYKWYHALEQLEIAKAQFFEYERALEKVKFNSVRNHKAKTACKPYRLY